MIIRPETSQDISKIHRVVELAFSRSELGHHGEAELVDTLRTTCDQSLSLVAELEGSIVGHVLFTRATLEREHDPPMVGMGLAPVSVLPDQQQAGIGSRLIREGLQRLKTDQVPFVIVLGHPDYYPRFGFLQASKLGVRSDFPDVPDDHFMIHPMATEPARLSGIARYHETFYPTD